MIHGFSISSHPLCLQYIWLHCAHMNVGIHTCLVICRMYPLAALYILIPLGNGHHCLPMSMNSSNKSQHSPFLIKSIRTDHMFTLDWCSASDHLVPLDIISNPKSRRENILFQNLNIFQFNAGNFPPLEVDKECGKKSDGEKQQSEEGSKGGILRNGRGGE